MKQEKTTVYKIIFNAIFKITDYYCPTPGSLLFYQLLNAHIEFMWLALLKYSIINYRYDPSILLTGSNRILFLLPYYANR